MKKKSLKDARKKPNELEQFIENAEKRDADLPKSWFDVVLERMVKGEKK